MKIIALIPARYSATRFPGKLMQMLGNKTVINRTYQNTVATKLFDEIIVVTDSQVIFNEIVQHGGKALMSKKNHESGSDRIAEVIADLDVDVVVNVQGDEPFVKKEMLYDLLNVFKNDEAQKVEVASLMYTITDKDDIANPNHVKVVVDKNSNALFFSRSVIPYPRDENSTPVYYKHIGIYAFRKNTLLSFTHWKPTPLETIEKLEQLRYLENGIKIKMVLSQESPLSIDTEDDLRRAQNFI